MSTTMAAVADMAAAAAAEGHGALSGGAGRRAECRPKPFASGRVDDGLPKPSPVRPTTPPRDGGASRRREAVAAAAARVAEVLKLEHLLDNARKSNFS